MSATNAQRPFLGQEPARPPWTSACGGEADGAASSDSPGDGAGDASITMRPGVFADALYGRVRVAAWAGALLLAAPFQRLEGISLSDVPGEMLFGRPFPSRLEHARGVYHLARLARPRDRLLQAAALAHDLGHGPFGHITEPVMKEWLGCDHEQRAARQLAAVRGALPSAILRRMAWLDWGEVASLVVGEGSDGRGALLNGCLDYDNIDNVARFFLASGMGQPAYAPQALARGLRVVSRERAGYGDDEDTPEPRSSTFLLPEVQAEALGWQTTRAQTYAYLHGDHRNLAPHAMLRKAVELAYAARALLPAFLDMTDAEALAALCGCADRGAAALAKRVQAGPEQHYVCLWEAEVPPSAVAQGRLASWRARLALEAELAGEAGLMPHDVILEVLVSRAARALPPLSPTGRKGTFAWAPAPLPARPILHVFTSANAPTDYRRRLSAAALRRLAPLGAHPEPSGQA